MAKIFMSFFSGVSDPNNKNAIPCFYESFIQGLQKSGNEVLTYVSKVFNRNFDNIPNNLLSEIKKFNPDIIILFNNAFYDIAKYFECPIFIYEVDSPLFYSNKKALTENINRYKFIVVQEESKNILIQSFKASAKNILIAPFFSEIKNVNIDKKQNISFIGTKFVSSSKTPFSRFMEQNPTIEEIDCFKNLIIEFEKNPFISDEEIFRNFHIESEKIKNNFKTKDLIFYLSDYNRTKTLSCISDLGLKIFGTKNWVTDNYNEPFIILNYDKTPVYSIKHNQDIYNTSKIGININHLQAKQGFSWRVCDIMASGACLVSEYKPDLKKYFSNINLPTFQNPYEARELCIKLINNENMREDIVLASNEIIDKNFRFKNIKSLIENYFDVTLSGNKNSINFIIENHDYSKKQIKLKNKIYLSLYNKIKRKLEKKGII